MFMFGIRDETFLENLDAWMAFIDGDSPPVAKSC